MLQIDYGFETLYKTDEEKRKAFGSRLRKLRYYYRLPAEDIAELSKIARGRYSEYETGKRLPACTTLNRIIASFRKLGTPSEELNKLRAAHDLSVSVSSPYTLAKMRRTTAYFN